MNFDNKKQELQHIVAMYESYRAAKTKIEKKWRQIRSLFEGDFWEILQEKIKSYQLTPDTNYIEETVTAYVNSIYTGLYVPEAKALDLNMNDTISSINAFLEAKWLELGMKKRFMVWGENTVLYNMQPVKTYIEKKIKRKGKKETEELSVKMEDIDPFSIFLDPTVNDFKEGQAIFIVKDVNLYSLTTDPRFKDAAKSYAEKNKEKLFPQQRQEVNLDYDNFQTVGNKTVSLMEYYIKEDGKIINGFIINKEEELYKTTLKINEFPIEILYFRKPTKNPYGVSLISKIMNSYITLNLLDSMDATQPYLEQNRPRFFDLNSRINARSFIDYGNTPGAVFPTLKEPSKSIYYQEMKMNADTTNIKARIEQGIFRVTGVDPAYKGRQTNSIITTGGIQQQQARVIMLTDNGPLVSLEDFVEKNAKLFIKMHIDYIESVPLNKTVRLDKDEDGLWITEQAKISFKDLDPDKFQFIMESIPYIPMTKQTRYETLIQLYTLQGQYNFQVPLVTEDDILEELPVTAVQKAKMKQRISSEKQATASAKRRETLMTFAALFQEFKNAGLQDEEATQEALATMDQEEMMRQQDPSLGVNPQGVPPQGGMPQGF